MKYFQTFGFGKLGQSVSHVVQVGPELRIDGRHRDHLTIPDSSFEGITPSIIGEVIIPSAIITSSGEPIKPGTMLSGSVTSGGTNGAVMMIRS